jgi:D-alanyl-D-alanine carboxypeptidase
VGISPLTGGGNGPGRPGATRAALAGAFLLALALLAALGALLGLYPGSAARAHSRAAAARAHRALVAGQARPAPPRSPLGLALGAPPLSLSGLGLAQQDPLRVSFARPPRAGLVFDIDTGRVLWQRKPLLRLRIASLDKMMTALIAVRSAPPRAPVLITRQAVEAPGSKVGVLPVGRRVPVETMLYGLLLPSGNDAAVALAQHVAGSVSEFVERMNREAAALGLGCTRYSSPSGYYNEGNFSCAADLAVLAHVDLQQPRLAAITRTLSAALPFPIKGGRLFLYNNNPLLIYGYPGVTGLKTGYTEQAGRCLVATAERSGVRLGVVLLDSPAPGSQASRLLNLAFQRVYHQRPVPQPAMPPGA